MLWHLVKKEILEHLMSLRFAIACGLCLAIILCSLFIRCRDYGQVLDDYHQESAMEAHRLETMDHPWPLVWGGIKVCQPPNVLKIFARGVDDTNGGIVRVPAGEALQPIIAPLQNTAVPLFPSIDLVTFVGLIMSLMAVVFGYDSVCGEKERGTLRLMLSYNVPRHTVLLSKWLGGYLTLVIPFLMAVVSGAVIVMIQPNISLTDGDWARLVAMLGFALVFIAAVYSLSLYVSCLTSRASTSVMVLLSIWVVLVLAAPNMAPYVAQAWRPAANAQEIESARSSAAKEIWDRDVEQKMAAYDKANGFGQKWWREIDWSDWNSRKRASVRRIYELGLERTAHVERMDALAKIEQHYGRQLEEQIELSRWIGRVSPFASFAMASTELADAGVMEGNRRMEQLRAYQREMCAYGYGEWIALNQYQLDNNGKRPPPWNKSRTKAVPAFQYVPPAAGDYARMVVVDAGVLAGMALLFFMLSYVTFLRYDVR